MSAKFQCCECGRHIVSLTDDKPPEDRRCLAWRMMPGWMDDPLLREQFGVSSAPTARRSN
jgi:hypothetical protein